MKDKNTQEKEHGRKIKSQINVIEYKFVGTLKVDLSDFGGSRRSADHRIHQKKKDVTFFISCFTAKLKIL